MCQLIAMCATAETVTLLNDSDAISKHTIAGEISLRSLLMSLGLKPT